MSETRYLVTARKYRPQIFGEIVSQEHVSATLRNAISLDRLAHAYLFSGPRGVGKTTAARILAKAINCTTPLDDRDNGEPCRTCESCRSFEAGRSLNIIEIDAASNNSVEDVRALREKVLIPPQGARKKVYIIDEVHMLSNAAFNALLKTLEEPPPHVLFIFATTEPHKVLPTILSRCQRFDFRRIGVNETVERLRHVCREENITADDASLILMARKGDGALRDALSVFDQAVSLCGTTLEYDELAEALGVVSSDLFFQVTGFVKQRSRAEILGLVATLVDRGYDFQEFLAGLAEHIRNLLVALTTQKPDLIEEDTGTRKRYMDAAADFSEADLLRMLMLVDATQERIRNAPQPRLKLELALLKMSHLERSVDLEEVLAKLGGQTPEGPGEPQHHRKPSVPAGSSARTGAGAVAATATPPSSQPPGPRALSDEERSRVSAFPQPALKPEPKPPAKEQESGMYAGAAALSAVPKAKVDPHFGVSLEKIKNAWPEFTTSVIDDRIHVGAMLQHAVPAGIDQDELQIAVPDDFHKRLLANQRTYLEKRFAGIVDVEQELQFQFVINDKLSDLKTLADADDFDPFEHLKGLRQENPIIRAIFDQFGGEPVW